MLVCSFHEDLPSFPEKRKKGRRGEGRGGRGRGGKGREEKRRPLVVNVRSHRRVMKNGVYSSLSKLFEKNKKYGSI